MFIRLYFLPKHFCIETPSILQSERKLCNINFLRFQSLKVGQNFLEMYNETIVCIPEQCWAIPFFFLLAIYTSK